MQLDASATNADQDSRPPSRSPGPSPSSRPARTPGCGVVRCPPGCRLDRRATPGCSCVDGFGRLRSTAAFSGPIVAATGAPCRSMWSAPVPMPRTGATALSLGGVWARDIVDRINATRSGGAHVSRSVATLIDRRPLARHGPLPPSPPPVRSAPFGRLGRITSRSSGGARRSSFLLAPLLFVRLPLRVSPLLLAAAVDAAPVTLLLLATGGTASGFGPLYLVAVVGLALFGSRRVPSIVVLLVLLGLLAVVSIKAVVRPWPRRARPGPARRGQLSAVGLDSRAPLRLTQSKRHTEQLLHQAESINAAARRLSSLLEPAAIAALGAQLAAGRRRRPGRPGGARAPAH